MTDLDNHEPPIVAHRIQRVTSVAFYDFDHAGRLTRAKGFNTSNGSELDHPFKQFCAYDAFDNLGNARVVVTITKHL
jgi:hypothetical protein